MISERLQGQVTSHASAYWLPCMPHVTVQRSSQWDHVLTAESLQLTSGISRVKHRRCPPNLAGVQRSNISIPAMKISLPTRFQTLLQPACSSTF